MTATTSKARYLLQAYYPLLTGQLFLRTKVRAYKQLIRPVLTYGSLAWSTASACQKHKLAVIQNRILRIAAKAPHFVRNSTLQRGLKTDDLLDHIRNLTLKFLDNTRQSKNPTVRSGLTPGKSKLTHKNQSQENLERKTSQ
ncbi:hypothetical protein D910_12230 [Dendroctonus ponderosae]|uniref:Uncharacterized protein n=1 Tax=Dendroctonus ponderosae TaxID=77166 RepID=U4UR27_DENPD|nr:hypothetical protein D910_12230 [Dendroctonus ponderosae]